jgi:glycosyltransferase involved in cell wall biosynthesis
MSFEKSRSMAPDGAPKIGLVMPLASQQGGAEALFQHLLREGSDRLDYRLAFLEEGPIAAEARALGYDTTVIPITHLSDPINFARTVLAMRGWVGAQKLAAVFSWMLKAHFYVAPAVAFTGVPTAWFQHCISIDATMDKLATRLPARAIFCCSDHSRAAQNRLPPHRRTFTCYPGVSFPPGKPLEQSAARKALGLPLEGRLVGMVARWERWKGPHLFLRACERLLADDPKLNCFLAGGAHPLDKAYASEIEAQASTIGDRFLLVGQRPAAEIPLWQASADLIVHPVSSPEPFGMAICEAMGMGKVVVASALGGPVEIIENGKSGILIQPEDVDSIVTTVKALLADDSRREALAQAAFARGRSFSIPVFAHRFQDLLLETLLQRP